VEHTKKVFKIMNWIVSVIMILSIISLVSISAGNLDNARTYDTSTRTTTITNSFGLGETIAEIKLNSEQVVYVTAGTNRQVAEIEFKTLDKTYPNALSKIETYQKGRLTAREITYKKRVLVKMIDEPICIGDEIVGNDECAGHGTVKVPVYSWETITDVSGLVNGDIDGLFADVHEGDYIEWIPTWFGVEIPEWAVWTSGLNTDIISYWTMNESTGDGRDRVYGHMNLTTFGGIVKHGENGIINSSFGGFTGVAGQTIETTQLTGIDSDSNGTINLWVNFTDIGVGANVNYAVWGLYDTSDKNDYANLYFNNMNAVREASFYLYTGGTARWSCETVGDWLDVGIPRGQWAMVTINHNGTDVDLYVNGTMLQNAKWQCGTKSPTYWLDDVIVGGGDTMSFGANRTNNANDVNYKGGFDESGIWNRSLSDAEITQLWNDGSAITYETTPEIIVSLGTPLDNSTILKQNNSVFNATISAKGGLTLTNASLLIYNSSKNLIYFDTHFITGVLNSSGNFYWNATTLGQYNWSVLGCSTTVCSISSNRTLTVSDFFENSQTYNATTLISSNEGYVLNLTYDSSSYPTISANLIYNGTSYVGTKVGTGNTLLFTKSLIANTTGTFGFYWQVAITNSLGDVSYYNSTNQTQLVSALVPINVSSTICSAGFNTTYVFSFADEVTKNLIQSNVSYNLNYGISTGGTYFYGNLSNIDKLYICINSSSPSYYIYSAEIDYKTSGYTDRKYYLFQGTRLIKDSTNITLYSLDSTLAVPFSFTIQDNQFTPQVDAFLSLLRWYPSTNSYEVVEMGKTDNKGQTVGSIAVNTVDYRIGVYNINGTLLNLFDPIRFVCTTSPCSYNVFLPATATGYISIDGLQSSLVFNSTSKIFTYTWNDPTQATTSMNLTVFRDAYDTSTVICSLVGAGFTGLLSCDASAYTGTVRAVVYRTASPAIPIDQLIARIGTAITDVAGGKTIGLFMSFIFFTFAILAGIWNPVVALILGIVALIPALYVGAISYTVIIGVILLVFLTIHFLRRS